MYRMCIIYYNIMHVWYGETNSTFPYTSLNLSIRDIVLHFMFWMGTNWLGSNKSQSHIVTGFPQYSFSGWFLKQLKYARMWKCDTLSTTTAIFAKKCIFAGWVCSFMSINTMLAFLDLLVKLPCPVWNYMITDT